MNSRFIKFDNHKPEKETRKKREPKSTRTRIEKEMIRDLKRKWDEVMLGVRHQRTLRQIVLVAKIMRNSSE